MQNARVLIVDENANAAQAIGDGLVRAGYVCELADSGTGALETVERLICDIVICDVRMGGMGDMELLDRLKKGHPGLPVIILASAAGGVREAVDAMKHGAFQYVTRPFEDAELQSHMVRALAERGAGLVRLVPIRVAKDAYGNDLVCTAPSMRALVEAISLVAVATAPVLIFGESGTGKERVARAIHARGPRRSRPFVAVNTSAIPEQLLESEVFGHARGAFTGATQARRGLLAEADGGTLLLDEIGDMPLVLQAKLLRMLQFGEARPVGSDHMHHVDVRVIAATHRDLSALVRDGRFREDLRYRLNVVPLVVPPLRERREDIAPLAKHFLASARERTPSSPVKAVSPAAMEILVRASWFGNVRELESTIERLVVLGRDEVIGPRALAFLDPPQPPGVSWPTAPRELWTLARLREQYIAWVLAHTAEDKVRAAKILAIDPSTLYRRQRGKTDKAVS